MAFFRIPLWLNKKINFWKLLGCGRNGTFDIHPDWRQWAILSVSRESSIVSEFLINHKQQTINYKLLYGKFITVWWKFFHCEIYTIILEPIEGHGTWDGKEVFGVLPRQTGYEGKIAILTRATIRLKRLSHFWKNVDVVAAQMAAAPGFIASIGIGEMPWIKQATFSIWNNKESMKQFAYKMQEHTAVIRKTREEKWYSEEMFIRFKPVVSFGSLHCKDPLKGKL